MAEFVVLGACLCRSPFSPCARPSKALKVKAQDTAGAGKPGQFATADDEYNLCVRVLHKFLANDEAASKAAGCRRLNLSAPEWRELVQTVDDTRPLPGGLTEGAARLAWDEIITRCGGINGVLELVLRDRVVRPSEDHRRGHLLCIRPLEEAAAGVGEVVYPHEINLQVALHDDGGLKIILGSINSADTLNFTTARHQGLAEARQRKHLVLHVDSTRRCERYGVIDTSYSYMYMLYGICSIASLAEWLAGCGSADRATSSQEKASASPSEPLPCSFVSS